MPAFSPKIQDINASPYDQKTLECARVARVVKGGRRFRFRVLVVMGDGKGKIGLGVAKGSDVPSAVKKAGNAAKKNLRPVVITDSKSIPHEVLAKQAGAKILLKPARAGTGLITGGTTREILEMAGYQNIYSKSLGNSNKINLAYAVFKALDQLVAEDNWHLKQIKKPAVNTKVKEAKKKDK